MGKQVIRVQAERDRWHLEDGGAAAQPAISSRPRAGDADRDRTISHLTECHATGYITAGEHQLRTEAAALAITRDELRDLTSDLPSRDKVTRVRARRRRLDNVTVLAKWAQQDIEHRILLMFLSLLAGIVIAVAANLTPWRGDIWTALGIAGGVTGFGTFLAGVFLAWSDQP